MEEQDTAMEGKRQREVVREAHWEGVLEAHGAGNGLFAYGAGGNLKRRA